MPPGRAGPRAGRAGAEHGAESGAGCPESGGGEGRGAKWVLILTVSGVIKLIVSFNASL